MRCVCVGVQLNLKFYLGRQNRNADISTLSFLHTWDYFQFQEFYQEKNSSEETVLEVGFAGKIALVPLPPSLSILSFIFPTPFCNIRIQQQPDSDARSAVVALNLPLTLRDASDLME